MIATAFITSSLRHMRREDSAIAVSIISIALLLLIAFRVDLPSTVPESTSDITTLTGFSAPPQ